MKPSTKDQMQGSVEELKGKAKEKVGQMTGNPQMEDDGRTQKVAGKVQKKVGQIEKVFEN